MSTQLKTENSMGAREPVDEVWWVVGRRDGLAPGAQAGHCGAVRLEAQSGEEWLGPFASREEARCAWSARAWETVDDACLRWRIVCHEGPVGDASD